MNQYRLTTPEEREKFYHLYLYTFNNTDSPERQAFFNARYAHGWIYGLHDDHDQLISGLYSLPFTINFHGIAYQMHGIGDVMSAPEHSGRGGAGTLLQASLDEMLANHVTLAYLSPFSYTYYRRFGYEQVFNHMIYTLDSQKAPNYHSKDSAGRVERVSLQKALSEIKPFYANRVGHLAGGMVRMDWWWNYLTLKHHWNVGLYYDATDTLAGYLIYERTEDTFVIQELETTTTTAFEHLIQFTLNHRNTFSTLKFDSADSRYHADWFADPYSIEAKTVPYMMARIVDLRDFLERYPYRQADFPLVTFSVEDENLSQNTGVWALSRKHGQTTLTQKNKTPNGPTLSIQQLTKALFGTTNLVTQAKTGKNPWPSSLNIFLDSILVNTPPQFKDYF